MNFHSTDEPREQEVCLICGRDLTGYRPDAIYCSNVCAQVATRRRKKLRDLAYKMLEALTDADKLRLDIETAYLLSKIGDAINPGDLPRKKK